MNGAQRRLSVATLALGVYLVAEAVLHALDDDGGGWFGPQGEAEAVVAPSPPGSELRPVLVWLVALVLWLVLSLRILRRPGGRRADGARPD